MTNDLSFIAAIAGRHVDSSIPDTPVDVATTHVEDAGTHTADDWRLVFERTQSAFDHVYGLVDYLAAMQDPRHTISSDENAMAALTVCLATNESDLQSLGYRGHVDFAGFTASPVTDAMRETLDLIGELFANIRKYGEPSQQYLLSVRIGATDIHITQTNTVRKTPLGLHRHGSGLNAHARRVSGLGGTIRWHGDADSWILHAVIPL